MLIVGGVRSNIAVDESVNSWGRWASCGCLQLA